MSEDKIIALIVSFVGAYFISRFTCKMIVERSMRNRFKPYDEKTDKFYCPHCGKNLSIKETFFEYCTHCQQKFEN